MENKKENQAPMSPSISRLQINVKNVKTFPISSTKHNESLPLKNKIEKNSFWNAFEPSSTHLNELIHNGSIKVESAKNSPLKMIKNIKLNSF